MLVLLVHVFVHSLYFLVACLARFVNVFLYKEYVYVLFLRGIIHKYLLSVNQLYFILIFKM